MEDYLFMNRLIRKLGEETFLRRVFARALQVLAGLIGLAALIEFFQGWKIVFDLPGEAMVGGIVYQLLFIIAIYMVIHAVLIRARKVGALDPGASPAISISASLLKLAGEVYASISVVLGIASGIFLWFAGREGSRVLMDILPWFPFLASAKGTFYGGVLVIIRGLIYGLGALLAGYLAAEILDRVGKNPPPQ